MKFLTTLLLLPLSTASISYDFFPSPPKKWGITEKQIWISPEISNVYISPTDQREHWSLDHPPWEIVELLDTHCPLRSCNTTLSIPTAVLSSDNAPPVIQNVSVKLKGYFEAEGYRGTKRRFIDVLKVFLRITHEPLHTEFVEYKNGDATTGNIADPGHRAVYTAPKAIQMRINNEHDDDIIMPFLRIQVDSGIMGLLPMPDGFCGLFKARRRKLLKAMAHEFGGELVMYRMGCILAGL